MRRTAYAQLTLQATPSLEMQTAQNFWLFGSVTWLQLLNIEVL